MYLEYNAKSITCNRRLGVYFASCIAHAPVGNNLMSTWTEFHWTSRWPRCHVGKVPDSTVYAKLFWEHDLEDVTFCDIVLVYSEPNDTLRGALVEAGMGIALCKKIVVVGENYSYSTWQYHPAVMKAASLEEARVIMRVMAL